MIKIVYPYRESEINLIQNSGLNGSQFESSMASELIQPYNDYTNMNLNMQTNNELIATQSPYTSMQMNEELDFESIFTEYPSDDCNQQSVPFEFSQHMEPMPIVHNIAQTSLVNTNAINNFAIDQQYMPHIPVPTNTAPYYTGVNAMSQQSPSVDEMHVRQTHAYHHCLKRKVSKTMKRCEHQKKKLGRPVENYNKKGVTPRIKQFILDQQKNRLEVTNHELKWRMASIISEMNALKTRFINDFGYLPPQPPLEFDHKARPEQ
ncbi:unnamed protein product [Medioppia subpectinata]|uniref:Uncharacterized protein n=1 Tax=Medioppia subpectinata TaxID=1979941 RepID=A0A7R9KQQ6_9ACAR|nr:unnamed protein product [Medioppia subpectinata]CAG2108070.1 unnamed protein product [Medioppia subpectinata]